MHDERVEHQAEPLFAERSEFRLPLLVALMFFLNAQRDGFLPGSPDQHQGGILVLTLLFLAVLAIFFVPGDRTRARLAAFGDRAGRPQALLLVAALFFVGAGGLFFLASRYYAAMGYHLHAAATALVFAGGGIAMAALALSTPRPRTILATAIALFAAAWLLTVWSFPLTTLRSDMLPLLGAAETSLTAGRNPYHLYTFPNETVFLTYLPGTVLAFLPAALLHLDLRITDLLCVAALAVLLLRQVRAANKPQGAALLSVFLLSPYLIYRHEIYTEPHWLVLIASLLLLQRGKILWAAALFGLSISMSQFSWVLFPFLVLYLWQSRGAGAALKAGAVAAIAASAVMLPFILWSPHDFYFGTLSHWQDVAVNARPVNLSYWTAKLVGARNLQKVQGAVMVALFLWCVARRNLTTFSQCIKWMAIGLLAFILLNVLVWGYFFLLLELLLMLYLFSANGWLDAAPEVSGA